MINCLTVRSPSAFTFFLLHPPGTSLPDAALTADILTVLNNGIYSDTLAALQGGEVISYGAVSQTAAGLQQTLVDFGCDIAVDGSAGPGRGI